MAIGAEQFAHGVVGDVESQVFFLFMTDNAAMVAYKTGLVDCFALAVRNMAESTGNAFRVAAELPIQVFLMMLPRGTVGPESAIIGDRDKGFIEGHRATGLVLDGKIVLSGGIVASQVALATDGSLIIKGKQCRVDDKRCVTG